MNTIWGLILTILASIAYFGQVITVLWPAAAVRLGLSEPESAVDVAFYADLRGESIWDSLILWPLPLAGLLLIFGHPAWPFFGLVGAGMFLYFAGRGILVRLQMQRRGIRIGAPQTLKTVYLFLSLWGLAALITIFLAIRALLLP